MDGYSVSIKQEQIEKLKEIFPEVVTEGKVDWEKLKATLSEDINFANERYVLNWAGKSEAFKALDVQTSATLKPVPEESINFDTTQNIFIEGENLEVLKVLRKSYYGKIKCIIIDPPYNTGSDSFIYPDSFKENKADYEKRIGDKDEEGYLMKEGLFRKNSKDSGHFHSNWLSMMYPRLSIVKTLLKKEGIVFVFIDDNEVHNLKLLMNEIFGEENFLADIIWEKRYTRSNDAKFFASVIDHVLVYRKGAELKEIKQSRSEKSNEIYKNPDSDPRGDWTSVSYVSQRTKTQRKNLSYSIKNPFTGVEVEHPTNAWKFSKEQCERHTKENRLWWGTDGGYQYPRLKKFLSELGDGVVPSNLWKYQEVGTVDDGTKEVDALLGKDIFQYPKPISVIKRILDLGVDLNANDIVLDFFAGSASTGHAVLDLINDKEAKLQFILVQLPELCDVNSEAHKQGYRTIADISKARLRRVIQNIQAKQKGEIFNVSLDIGFKSFKLSPSNFKVWRGDEITEDNLVQQLEAFTNPVKEESNETNMLYELIIKAGYLLTDKVESKGAFYSINDGEMIIALKEMNTDVTTAILAAKPKKVLTLDNLFAGNDQLKTNTVLQMRDAGIDFKTI